MADTDCEIEYLDEDADIVQQCVQPLPVPITETKIKTEQKFSVERDVDNNRKRKRKEEEDDSDYDPSMEEEPLSPARTRKRKPAPVRKAARVTTPTVSKNTARETKNEIMKKKDPATLLKMRKKMEILIPDYEDPLCLPVRALKKTAGDLQRLRSWNDVCMEHFKHCNTLLRPEKGQTKSSTRTIVLRNVVHKETGNHELAVWSKTCVENMEGVKKSEIFQSILPKYREKMLLNQFNLQWQRKDRRIHNVDEVILTKEKQKEEETLVVYKPLEKLSAVYKTIHNPDVRPEDEPRKALKEVVCCKICAPCYQTSWRGNKKNSEKNINCPICKRASVSVYNLLTHLRAHAPADVAARRPAVAAILAKFVEYHYKCRVCSKRFSSIKGLRKHIITHKGTEMFHCEVGSHMAS